MYKLSHVLAIHGLKPKSVLHIGAHIGQELSDYKAMGVSSGVFIEADPKIFSTLENNLKDEPNWKAINALVSDQDGQELDFWLSDNDSMSSSLLKPKLHLTEHPEVMFDEQPVTLRSSTLDSLQLGQFDLVSIDVQGAEFKVLKGGMETIRHAQAIWLEVSLGGLYEGDCSINDLVRFLYRFDYYPVYTVIGSTMWGDAMFVKKSALMNRPNRRV